MADSPVNQSELLKALDDLIMAEAPPELLPDDITLRSLAKRAKCGPTKARTMLEKWVAEGKAEYIGKRREVRGHAVDAWRLVKV
jgi:hypothetical protein